MLRVYRGIPLSPIGTIMATILAPVRIDELRVDCPLAAGDTTSIPGPGMRKTANLGRRSLRKGTRKCFVVFKQTKKIGASCARTYILSRFPRASNNSSTDQKATSRHKMMCFLKVETCPILNIRDLFMLHGRDRWSMKRITTWRGGRSSCLFWGKKKRPFGLCFNH